MRLKCSVTNQRLTLSLASESGGMLLILFMVSISSLRSGWIWTKEEIVSGLNLSKQYGKSATSLSFFFYYYYLPHPLPWSPVSACPSRWWRAEVRKEKMKKNTLRQYLTDFHISSRTRKEKKKALFFYCGHHKQGTYSLLVSHHLPADFMSWVKGWLWIQLATTTPILQWLTTGWAKWSETASAT